MTEETKTTENKEPNTEGAESEQKPEGEKRTTLTLPKTQQFSKNVDDMTDEEAQQEALKWGQIPKEEWKGDPSTWQDPKTFLRKAGNNVPHLLRQLKKYEDVIRTRQGISERQEKLIEGLKKENEHQRAGLSRQKKEAFENADYDSYENLEKHDRELQSKGLEYDKMLRENKEERNSIESKALEETAYNKMLVDNWRKQHPRFDEDPHFREEAIKIFGKYEATGLYSVDQILAMVTDDIYKPKKSTASSYQNYASSPSTMAKSNNKAKSYENLTEGARQKCDNFVHTGGGKVETYLKYSADDNFIWAQKK